MYRDWGAVNPLNNAKTLFDEIRSRNVRFLYCDWPIKSSNKRIVLDWLVKNNDESKINNLIRQKDRADIFWLRIWDLDSVSHEYGPNSIETDNCIKRVDDLCQKLYLEFAKDNEVEFLFWSDHGMLEINKTICFNEVIKDIKYPYFLDSTLARFWPNTNKEKTRLLGFLKKIDGGRIMEKLDYEKYNLDYNDKRYGEVIFAVDPGNLIFPNFYSATKPVKGMHGYDPLLIEQRGLYISSCGYGRINKKMVDMYGEIINFLK